MFLGGIYVCSYKYLVKHTTLEPLVDETLVVLPIPKHKSVGDGPLEELGSNIGHDTSHIIAVVKVATLAVVHQISRIILVRVVHVAAAIAIWYDNQVIVTDRPVLLRGLR